MTIKKIKLEVSVKLVYTYSAYLLLFDKPWWSKLQSNSHLKWL